jgi:hypothetical protein
MFKFLVRMFQPKPVAPTAPAPYKVETPQEPIVPVRAPKPVAEPKAKKPTVKKATTRKPKAPKA